jgi:hypothetical protein
MKSVEEMSDAELDDLLSKGDQQKSVDSMSDGELDALLAKTQATSQQIAQPDGYGPLATYAGNALDTLTLDHGPNIISAVKNGSVSSPDYVKDRDAHRKMLEQGKIDNPVARYAGAGTGLIAPVAATLLAPEATVPAYMAGAADAAEGVNAAKTVVPSVGKAIGANFLINEGLTGLQNPGDVEGKASGLQLQDRFNNMTDPTNMLTNGLIATGTGVVENKLAKMAQNKDKLAFKALQPSAKNVDNMVDLTAEEMTPDRAAKVGSLVRNSGILKGSPNIIEIAKRAQSKLGDYGKNISAIFEGLDSKLGTAGSSEKFPSFDTGALEEALNKKYKGDAGVASTVADKIDEIIADHYKYSKEGLRPSDLQSVRQTIQDKVNYSRLFTSDAEQKANHMFADAATMYNQYIDNVIKNNADKIGEAAGTKLKIANQQYNLMSDAAKIAAKAGKKVDGDVSAQKFMQSIIPSLATGLGVGTVMHSPMMGVATGLGTAATSMAVPRANSMAANLAASKSAPYLAHSLNLASKLGQTSMAPQQAPMPPPPMLTPYQIDQQIKNDPQMTQSQKAKARQQNSKGSQ